MLDRKQYQITVGPKIRFHIGEPVTVRWRAPTSHSRKDWIGIYRVRYPVCLFYGCAGLLTN